MPHIYEIGYGTPEESEYAQLVHRRKFSKMRFESMVLDCVGQATKMEYELHKQKWSEDICASHYFEQQHSNEEKVSYRKYELEFSMKCRLAGNEESYTSHIRRAYFMESPSFSYQDLHKLVVRLMCDTYGFSPIEKLRCAYFDGWGCLADDKYPKTDTSVAARASRLVKKVLSGLSINFLSSRESASAEAKWIARRESAIDKNPAAGDRTDAKLCEELGVEFIPYNHPDAVKARSEYNTPINFSQVMDEFIGVFSESIDNE